jgi:gamma-glutamylputrescine oxidase
MKNPYSMNLSYWETDTFFNSIDVLIIGSGIVGLNAAITIKEKHPDWRVLVLERGPIPSGASTRNAGFACFGSITELLADLKSRSETEVFDLVEERWRGLHLMRQRLGDQQIEFHAWGGYELFSDEDQAAFEESMDYMSRINRALKAITGFDHTFVLANDRISTFGFKKVNQLILNQAEGQIHTGKMMQTLLHLAKEKGIEIYNGLEVSELRANDSYLEVLLSNGWRLQATMGLIANNGFARNLIPELESLPARNQVLITKPIEGLSLKGTFHYQEGYWYFRNVGNRVLLGGGRHLSLKAEETDQFGFTDIIQQAQEKLLNEVIVPGIPWEIDQKWSGIMGVGSHKRPIIRKISPRLVAAVRLGGMGVAIGALTGARGAELLLS